MAAQWHASLFCDFRGFLWVAMMLHRVIVPSFTAQMKHIFKINRKVINASRARSPRTGPVLPETASRGASLKVFLQ
jgi:hypothetical protein